MQLLRRKRAQTSRLKDSLPPSQVISQIASLFLSLLPLSSSLPIPAFLSTFLLHLPFRASSSIERRAAYRLCSPCVALNAIHLAWHSAVQSELTTQSTAVFPVTPQTHSLTERSPIVLQREGAPTTSTSPSCSTWNFRGLAAPSARSVPGTT
eukprot:2182626-Rhodomonas_salina.2